MDCLAGAGTLALGHNHPCTLAAMRATLDSGVPLHTLDLTTPVKDLFVETLFAALPPAFAAEARIQFCGPTGADGIEAAIKLAKIATGRKGVFCFSGGYHGMTHGALSLMGNLGPKQLPGSLMPDVQVLPYPYDYRCPFALGGEAGIDAGLSYIGQLLSDPESGVPLPAAVVVEVVQGEGGVIPAPVRWLQGLRKLTRDHGVVLIIDEVQSGIGRYRAGRTGAVQGHRRWPAAGSGGLPAGARCVDAGCACGHVSRQSAGHGGRHRDPAVYPRRGCGGQRRAHGRLPDDPAASVAARLPVHR
jgi:diaminobutyrate-2-oxoglutarate transaminase